MVDITGTPATGIATGTGDPYTGFAYTPEAGSDRLAVLIIGLGDDVNDPATSVTLGGQAMTQLGSEVYNGTWVGVQVFILNEAGIAAMSGNTVSIGGMAPTQLGLIAFTITGVDQTTPTTSLQGGSGIGTTAQPSAAVVSTSGGLVIGAIMSDAEGGFSARSHTLVAETAVINSDTIAGAQSAAGTGGNITPSWTQASVGWAVKAFNVQAASGGAGPNDLSVVLGEPTVGSASF